MTIKERLTYARERARHYIHCTKYHREGESYICSYGYDLVFAYFMGVTMHEMLDHEANYLREILENDGR